MSIEKMRADLDSIEAGLQLLLRAVNDADPVSELRVRIGDLVGDLRAAKALLTSSASYRAGAEDMRERAAGVAEETIADLSAEQAGWRGSFGADCAQPHDDEIQTRREIASAIRSLPLPDPQPTPTQESRDV